MGRRRKHECERVSEGSESDSSTGEPDTVRTIESQTKHNLAVTVGPFMPRVEEEISTCNLRRGG